MNKRGFTLIEGLLVLIIVSIIGFGTFYVANDAVEDDSSSSLNNATTQEAIPQQTNEESPPEAKDQTVAEPVKDEAAMLYASGYRNEQTGILIDFLIGEGFTNYWVEYGQNPDDLTESSSKISDGLGYEFGGTFGSFTAVIDPTTLPNGDNIYFYRIAAEKQGTTHYTGISTFSYK